MRAAVYEKYGPPEVVHIADVPKPVPKEDEILVRIRASTVSTADWRARSLRLPPGFGPMGRLVFGIFRPRQPILGTDLAGEVEAVGKSVTRFKPGDAVIAYPGLGMGCHAEYKTLPEGGPIAAKPVNLTFEEAASLLFGGFTALDFFRRGGKPEPGQTMLVNGASGAVGSAFTQLGKHYGATVTAVTSTGNLDLVRTLGADLVVDYRREDFTRNGERYDIIVDTAGTAPYPRVKGSLKDNGHLFIVLGNFVDAFRPMMPTDRGHKLTGGTGSPTAEDVRLLADLATAGSLKPVIDSVYPLEQIAAAHARVDSGRKRGAVVVAIG